MRLEPHHRVFTCFFLIAVSMGGLLSRLPDIQERLDIDKSELGLTMIGAAVGALISLALSSPVVRKLSSRSTAFISVLGTALVVATVPWMDRAAFVFLLLFCQGLLAGALEISLNVEINRIEAEIGRGVMSRAHGFWSLGFFLTALAASFVRQAGISIELHMAAICGFVVLVGSTVISGMRNMPAPYSPETAASSSSIALPTIGLLPLCVIGVGAFLVEGAGIDWSAIYMRDVFDVEPFVGGLGLTLFSFCMAFARLFADGFVDRYGARAVGRALLSLAVIGLCCVCLAPVSGVALAGFALMGTGCSAVYPLALSAAAQRGDRNPHANVAAVAQMSFVVFFLAPPLLGFVAEHAGIRTSYLVCLPIILLSTASTTSLPEGARNFGNKTPGA
ncbi:MFS transporter [Rhizobium sp. P38BS-XIX]|uniref:MFS transporter n=1 Tax=Rhizobium sp. P38BS-XIX TaxID=2726740 RepID=UPI001456EB0E|nr:MFS transporter [Rhizobium sp. P38BS-XIX]NLR99909.1 MFS transporter [Rhizobium sp. P38BS-XIX]